MAAFSFKIADSNEEFEAIHALNYRTFVEEIPQHPPNKQRRLVDAFHDENTYAICKVDDELIGMIAGRANRPFSLDRKLDNLDPFLPPHRSPVEVRLLAVEPAYRKSSVFAQLVHVLATHFSARGHDLALISGTLRQTKLYQHMGFTPFGPQVGTKEALYQPMYLDLNAYADLSQKLDQIKKHEAPLTNLLPGPVDVKPAVAKALSVAPISHRSAEFLAIHKTVTDQLKELTRAKQAFLLSGSGTTANDAIAAQLSATGRKGLVISNGEFGERLLNHAERWQLEHVRHQVLWGESIDVDAVAELLAADTDIRWVWMVACETSTGINNPWEKLAEYCQQQSVDLCLDAISAIGTRPLCLEHVRFTSGVSGKALGAYPGISFVLYNGQSLPTSNHLPRALDLAMYQQAGAVPFTISSNLVYALSVALVQTDWQEKYVRINRVSSKLRSLLNQYSVTILAQGDDAAPAVLTIVLPDDVSGVTLCNTLRHSGYVLSGESAYLAKRNWIQISLFGEFDENMLYALPELIARNTREA